MRLKKNDQIIVIQGKERGKKGRIMKVFPKNHSILVEKLNYQTVYLRKSQQNPQGGIAKVEGKIDSSNVQLLCPRCSKPTHAVFSVLADGTKQRMCKHCHEII